MTAHPAQPKETVREGDRARRRRERIAIGIIAVLVAGLTFFEAKLATLGGSVALTSNIIIFALININVILIVLLIFLVTRNIFKLILDRKRNILGAKIRSRLVLIFIGFSLAPTILLFVAAANITTTSIKSWIGGRVGVALTGALEMARGKLEAEARSLSGAAYEASRRIPAGASVRKAGEILGEVRKDHAPRGTLILADPSRVVATSGEVSKVISDEILSRLKGMHFAERPDDSTTQVGDTYSFAARKIADGRVIVALKSLSPEEARIIGEISKAYDEYHQVRLLDDPIRASYIAVLILITLLIVFAASWMGIYLARQITVPVQMLAEGTEKVARGDLDARIEYVSNDEEKDRDRNFW